MLGCSQWKSDRQAVELSACVVAGPGQLCPQISDVQGWPGLLRRMPSPALFIACAAMGYSRLRSSELALCSEAEALDPDRKKAAYF